MKSPDSAMSPRAALVEHGEIACRRVAAVHRPQHAVVAGLDRQVQERHQLRHVAVGLDQALGHVVGMAGGIADPGEAGNEGEPFDQPLQPAPVGIAPGVDVLAQQGDLARAGFDQFLRFSDQIVEGTRCFRAAGIRHHAIGAELVAAFLHGQESAGANLAARGQGVELGLGRHVGIDRAAPFHRLGNHCGQAVIGLRADHHRHGWGTRHDFLALGLGDTAGDRDQGRGAVFPAQAADVGIDLFRRLLADVAGVEHHQVRLLTLGRGGDALLPEQFGHAFAIIDVHLAAEALDPVGPGGRGGAHGVAR
jgi:hypothetical protein